MAPRFHFQKKIVAPDIVVWEMSGTPSEAEWKSFMALAATWLLEQESRGKKWGVVIDPSGMQNVSAELRRIAGNWRAQNMALIANTCTCASYVAPSAVIRGAITAVFWFAPPVIPVSVRGSEDVARTWVSAKLRELIEGASVSA